MSFHEQCITSCSRIPVINADLSASLNPGRWNPRIILREHEGKFGALTVCTTVRTALYLMLLKMIVSGTEYGGCANCSKYFVMTVRGKKSRKRREVCCLQNCLAGNQRTIGI